VAYLEIGKGGVDI